MTQLTNNDLDDLFRLYLEIEVACMDLEEDDWEEELDDLLDDDSDGDRMMLEARDRVLELGSDAYRAEVADKIAALDSSGAVHVLAAAWGHNDDPWPLKLLVAHPLCDVVTARMIYWGRGADTVHRDWAKRGYRPDDWYECMVKAVEERATGAGFPEGLDVEAVEALFDDGAYGEFELSTPDYGDFIGDVRPDLDYGEKPWSDIPEVLR